jgi:hypothetical protein
MAHNHNHKLTCYDLSTKFHTVYQQLSHQLSTIKDQHEFYSTSGKLDGRPDISLEEYIERFRHHDSTLGGVIKALRGKVHPSVISGPDPAMVGGRRKRHSRRYY